MPLSWNLVTVAIVLYVIYTLRVVFRPGLRQLPGPLLARFSGLYRLSLVWGSEAPANYRKLHENYGPIVRVGPNHVSVSDPSMIPVIYGIGSKFIKVGLVWCTVAADDRLYC